MNFKTIERKRKNLPYMILIVVGVLIEIFSVDFFARDYALDIFENGVPS